ncbi:MAG: hypothetical protein R3E55_13250 [Burkholderiaceae bacterium]
MTLARGPARAGTPQGLEAARGLARDSVRLDQARDAAALRFAAATHRGTARATAVRRAPAVVPALRLKAEMAYGLMVLRGMLL